MTFDDYLKALGYTAYGEDNIRYKDASGDSVSPQGLEQLQNYYSDFSKTDPQGRPIYGTEAYIPGTMSGAYGSGLFRLGGYEAGPDLQPILNQMGASVQYDPRYGYVIPQAAQDQWSRQYGQPTGFDAFMENLASNAPIALGGAVFGAGLGYGPFAGGSLEGGVATGGSFANPWSGPDTFDNFGNLINVSGPDLAPVGGATGNAAGGNMFDWLTDDLWNGLMNTTATVAGSGDMFGAGTIDPSWWGNAAAPIIDQGTQAGLLDTLRNSFGLNGIPSNVLSGGLNAIGSLINGQRLASGANAASQYQAGTAQQGIDEQRRQFDTLTRLMAPYVNTGVSAIGGQSDLLGLGGPDKQAAAIAAIQNSPQFNSLVKTGEQGILQNASATGGLRGGNVQGALAKFRPQILSGLIDQQFSRLGGLSQLGQASAAGQAASGMGMANNISQLLGQQGSALAGGRLASAAYNPVGDLFRLGGLVGSLF